MSKHTVNEQLMIWSSLRVMFTQSLHDCTAIQTTLVWDKVELNLMQLSPKQTLHLTDSTLYHNSYTLLHHW